MTALAEALLAAQRQAIGAASKAYVAGALETTEDVLALLDNIGCTDKIEQGYLLASLEVLRQLGAQPTNGAAPKPDAANEPASQKQLDYIAKLADEKGTTAPDGPLTKARASQAISELQAGTYNADAYTAPF